MDKNFIKQNNLNEAVKRFQQIAEYKSPRQSLNEYTFVTNSQLEEDGEEDGGEMQQPEGNMPQQGPAQQPQNAPASPQNQEGDTNGQMGAEMPPQGNEMPQNGVMPQGDVPQPPMDNMGGDIQQPQDEEVPVDDGIETEEMEPDDEVIDVDELTQSQEATEYKIDGVDDRLSEIYAVVQKFSDQLEQQQQNIMKLKDEFEKRNPTQTEKFNLRSQAGGPYNQTPTEYWDKLSQENPNYEIMRDNDVSPSDEEKEFKIRKGDISGLNMKNISDTLNIDQNLSDYIGF